MQDFFPLSNAGLHLTLFIEQPEYLGILSPQTGAKLSIHDPDSRPFPEEDAIDLPTGRATAIGVRQVHANIILKKSNATRVWSIKFLSSSIYHVKACLFVFPLVYLVCCDCFTKICAGRVNWGMSKVKCCKIAPQL